MKTKIFLGIAILAAFLFIANYSYSTFTTTDDGKCKNESCKCTDCKCGDNCKDGKCGECCKTGKCTAEGKCQSMKDGMSTMQGKDCNNCPNMKDGKCIMNGDCSKGNPECKMKGQGNSQGSKGCERKCGNN